MNAILYPSYPAVSGASNSSITSAALALMSAALDSTGWISIRCLKQRMSPLQKFFAPGEYAGAVAETLRLSENGYDAYFATSTFNNNSSGKAENVNAVKTFKLDLDVDKGNPKKYAAKKDAVAALAAFCTQYGFPAPTLVDSGGGVHAYWIMTDALVPDDGRLYAEKLKALMLAAGVKIDPTVTGDIARILRVPGTLNYKKAVAREVVLKTAVAMHDTDLLCDLIDAGYANADTSGVKLPTPDLLAGMALPVHLRGVELDKTTRGLLEGKPKSFRILLKRSIEGEKGCAQIKDIHDHQASTDEPRWRAGLSIAHFCDDGAQAIHWISRGHNGYDHDATVAKAALTKGPYTCATFKSNWPEHCKDCKHKVASPIQLGIDEDISAPTTADDMTNDDATVIARLAALNKMEYDRVRTKEAEAIGVRVSTLDELVSEARGEKAKADDSPFMEVEPWPEPINPPELLLEITNIVRRFIICEQQTAIAAALWTTLTWFTDYVQVLPLAVITAPEKRCGKSLLLFLLARMTCRPLAASNISPAALFRSIDKWQPTLLIDEADAFLRENEETRGLINCGHTRDSAFSIRTVGEDFTPTRFNLWAAKAIAGIGHLADTLMDRAVVLELRRKLPHEKVERLRHADSNQFDVIARKLARFSQDFGAQVRDARPALPEELNDRAADNWEGLFSLADIAGGVWPELARRAALKLSGEQGNTDSIETELLSDIQEIFAAQAEPRIFSSRLVQLLCADEDRPWATYNRGAPIRARQIANKLKAYGIVPQTIRIAGAQSRGYELLQFADAFDRYLPQAVEKTAST